MLVEIRFSYYLSRLSKKYRVLDEEGLKTVCVSSICIGTGGDMKALL